jgi:hypothetical protein
MTSSSPGVQVDATGQLAQAIPGFNPTAVINAADTGLADYLGMPIQQILDKFRLGQLPSPPTAAPAAPGAPTNPGGSVNPIDPTQLISPVVNALGTLGNPQLAAMPTSMLDGISNAFDNVSGPVQQALAAMEQGWQGESGAATAAKTAAALANGSEVATQANGLQGSLVAAAAEVAKARAHLIEIINEFLATVAASGPNIFAIIAAAAKAVAETAQVMTETQSSLAAQAATVSAIGTPVNVTAAPQLGTSGAGLLGSLLGSSTTSAMSPASATNALGMLSPLMSVASVGISPALGAASMASHPAAAGAQSAALADDTDPDDPKSKGGGTPGPGGKAGGGGAPVVPAGGSGGAASGALVSRLMAPSASPVATESAAAAMPVGSTRASVAAIPAGGGGMMGTPLMGAGQGAGAGGAHTAASFLHTADHGGKVVGDRNTVAPPVIGEVDPYETPDIELRI